MKILKLINVLTVSLFILLSCEHQQSNGHIGMGSYELKGLDTFNVTDNHGLKQGYWIERGFVVPGGKRPNETMEEMKKRVDQVKLEEGLYKDNKKQGVWKYFHDDGTLKKTTEYKDGVPLNN